MKIIPNIYLFICLTAILFLNSCGEKLPETKLDIKRYELLLKQLNQDISIRSKDSYKKFYQTHFQSDWKLLATWCYDTPLSLLDSIDKSLLDSIFVADMVRMSKDKDHQKLIDSILKVYPKEYELDKVLTPPMQRLKKHIPGFEPPVFRTLQVGYTPQLEWFIQYEHDAVHLLAQKNLKDSTQLPKAEYCGIALEYFAGSKFSILHPQIPRYVRTRCTPENLPIAVAQKFCDLYQPPLQEFKLPTLIDRMIYHGIRYYYLDVILPDTPDSLKIHYTANQIKWITENTPQVYNELIPLLYEKGTVKVGKYVEEAPFTATIAPDAPPRLGQYMGWQIVRKYMQAHPELPLIELLKTTDYEKIFKGAGYKPV